MQAASKPEYPCDRNAPRIPASVSPVPPQVIPAFPVLFSAPFFPSEITSVLPFISTGAPSLFASDCTELLRAEISFGTGIPESRPNSITCGV